MQMTLTHWNIGMLSELDLYEVNSFNEVELVSFVHIGFGLTYMFVQHIFKDIDVYLTYWKSFQITAGELYLLITKLKILKQSYHYTYIMNYHMFFLMAIIPRTTQ